MMEWKMILTVSDFASLWKLLFKCGHQVEIYLTDSWAGEQVTATLSALKV